MVVTKRVIVPRTPAIGEHNSGNKDVRGMSGWGGTFRGTKDSTFFPGLSRSSSFKRNVRGLPTTFGYYGRKRAELAHDLEGKPETTRVDLQTQ